jgi:nitroreductase/NAD-dependent dihydropyrimidine dehydrogenase PreA subunit
MSKESRMNLITVEHGKCKKDGICLDVCPTGYLRADAEGLPVENPEANCIACGHCVAVCPHGALSHAKLPVSAFTPVPKTKPSFELTEGLLNSRRSIRAFKTDPIERPTLEKLLDVARRAPTASNSQKVGWIMIQDPAQTRRLAEGVMGWMRRSNAMPLFLKMWDQGREVVLRGAPHAVLACAPTDYAWADVDCAIALTHLELAASSLKLGACWAGILVRALSQDPDLAKTLPIPEGSKVSGALMLGVPKYKYRLIPPRNAAQVAWI